MKIVSKYKDFYDYIVQDYDADLVYVRNIGLVNEYLDEMFRKEGNVLPYYSKNYNRYADRYYRKNTKDGTVEFTNYIFGIYPFVYSQPAIEIFYNILHQEKSQNFSL